ncbi:MAG: hypothetical protein U0572_00255 [Phycisphaerales bacterium]
MTRTRINGTSVTFLNARTCGIYKNGGPRYKTDPSTGRRTTELDDELNELVDRYVARKPHEGITVVPIAEATRRRVLVPTYYDRRHDQLFEEFVEAIGWAEITLGDLIDSGAVSVRGGHGSPGNDQRSGGIPYIKVSDIRALRVNVNPTNLVDPSVAHRFWRGTSSGLKAFDLITPNRASSNIGEFAILLPGEEDVVVTKEVFILRVEERAGGLWDPFTLFWALCLRAVREQWRRIALMQTNREDCGSRYREIRLPLPPNRRSAEKASAEFREYFGTLATAKTKFITAMSGESSKYIASVFGAATPADDDAEPDTP